MAGIDNRTLLQKADLALSDLTSDGGLLVPAQAQRFIKLLIKEAVLMKMSTVVPMRAPKQLVEKIRFGSRVLRAGQEATALPAGDRAKPDLSKVELDAKLFKAEVHLDNEVLDDSIEQDQLRNTIMTLIAEAISRDMDDVIVNGDTASGDTFYAQFDGVLKQTTSNIVDAAGATLTKSILKDLIKIMPSEFLRRKSSMAFMTSVDAEIDLRDTYANRQTAMGDSKLQEDMPVSYSGVPVKPIPLFPENLGGGNNYTNTLFGDPKNIQVGVWRQIRIETDKDISAGVLKVVATLRFDTKFAEETAMAKAINILVA